MVSAPSVRKTTNIVLTEKFVLCSLPVMQSQFELLNEAEQAAAALHPIRSRLLECFREPLSAAEAARQVDMPRQRIGHHVRLLLRLGLLHEVGQRRRGAFTERLLQTTARAWAISPRALGAIGMAPDDIRDEFSSQYLAATASRTLRDVARLRELAEAQGKRVATLTVEDRGPLRLAGSAGGLRPGGDRPAHRTRRQVPRRESAGRPALPLHPRRPACPAR